MSDSPNPFVGVVSQTTSSYTEWYRAGGVAAALLAHERVYPCRCGETHTGEYAAYDHAHHNCFHDAPLVDIGGDEIRRLPDLPPLRQDVPR